MSATSTPVGAVIRKVPVFLEAIKIEHAAFTLPFAYLPSVDPELVVAVDYDFVPECNHYLQLQRPDLCHTLSMEFLASIGMV